MLDKEHGKLTDATYDEIISIYNAWAKYLGIHEKTRGDVIYLYEFMKLQNNVINKAFSVDDPFMPLPYWESLGWCLPYEKEST